MESKTFTVLQNNMILKIRKPISDTNGAVWFLIHGWTGDEHSMDPFWRYIPETHWIIAPRAPEKAHPSGYGWADINPDMFPSYDQFLPSVNKLYKEMMNYLKDNHLADRSINLFGFSQGAAASYMLAEMVQHQVEKIIPTAGFMPDGTLPHLMNIANKSIQFIVYHGAKDHLVPLSMADECVKSLEDAGFSPHYCVDENAGHKLGASCIEHLKSIA
jgi:predicted esterase